MPQYQGVWSLQQQMQALTSGQWATDPLFDYTTLLLQADDTGNGSQNQTFLDSSTNNFFITRNGNTTQGTFSPFSLQPGAWGNYFSGSPNYLSVADNAAFDFGTGNFCVEFWFNAPNQTTSYPGIVSSSGFSGAISIRYDNTGYDNKIFVYMNNGGDPVIASNSSIPNNTWAHVAVVRDSTTSLKIYINGVQDATATISASLATDLSVGPLYIGRGFDVDGANAYFTGYISNLRVTKGGAVYTTNFTPSTAPLTTTVPSGTVSLLACQNNRFVDNSVNAFAITVNGTPSVQAFSPFAPQFQYTASGTGGSGYFDGTGDWLALPSSSNLALGSGDFCVETWIYQTTAAAAGIIGNSTSAGDGDTQYELQIGSSPYYPRFIGWTSVFLTSSTAITINQWNHLAVCRSGTTCSMFLNGTRVATGTVSQNFSSTNALNIGRQAAGTAALAGYLSGTRIVKGSSVYSPSSTTITVPTAPLTAVTNTQLLTNFTNAGILDGTMKTSWETVSNAQISTSVVKYGSGSLYFNGTASQRLLPSQAYPFLTPGTADFTIECWMYVVAKGSTTVNGIIDYRPGVNGVYINWVVDFGGYGGSATAPTMVLYVSSAVRIRSDVVPLNQWMHIALCRTNGQTKMFINGVQTGSTYADTNNYLSGGSAGNYRPTIGCTDGGDSAYGYFDDFRISNFSRYPQNFIPPSVALPRQ